MRSCVSERTPALWIIPGGFLRNAALTCNDAYVPLAVGRLGPRQCARPPGARGTLAREATGMPGAVGAGRANYPPNREVIHMARRKSAARMRFVGGPAYAVQVATTNAPPQAQEPALFCRCCRRCLPVSEGHFLNVRGTARWLCWDCIQMIRPRHARPLTQPPYPVQGESQL